MVSKRIEKTFYWNWICFIRYFWKENSRKYEYQKGFNAEGWQCIENVISQHINNFNFQKDWLSEIYLSKKIDTNKLISLRDQLKNETKKKKRN